METDDYDFYWDWDNHTQIVKLPYTGNTSMMIVLPDEGRMQELERNINNDLLKYWHGKLEERSVPSLLILARTVVPKRLTLPSDISPPAVSPFISFSDFNVSVFLFSYCEIMVL